MYYIISDIEVQVYILPEKEVNFPASHRVLADQYKTFSDRQISRL